MRAPFHYQRALALVTSGALQKLVDAGIVSIHAEDNDIDTDTGEELIPVEDDAFPDNPEFDVRT